MITFTKTSDGGGGPFQSHKRILDSKLNEKYDFIPLYVPRIRVLLSYKGMKEFVSIIKRENPDIVHFSGLQLDGFLTALACRIARVKRTVLAIHGSSNEALCISNLQKGFINFLENRTLTMVTVCYGVSEYVANWDRVKKYAKSCFGSIYNMPHEEYKEQNSGSFRKEMGFNDGDIIITSTGRIIKDKGYEVLLKVIKACEWQDNVKFVIVGNGAFLDEMKSSTNESGLNKKVFFLGYRSDIGRILAASDIFVICTLHETLCNSIIEAGQQSLPSVVTNVGGIPEIIENGYNGFLVNANDITATVNALNKLIKDESIRQKMGESAHYVIGQKFNPEVITQQIDTMYRSILINYE
jgi:glycosyltransferase involved in cell wall biosynthesis